MCGIVGYVGPDPHDEVLAKVRRGAMTLAHRGPDDDTVRNLPVSDPQTTTVFGHRRLAVIDTSRAGDQPMPNEDATIYCVFNGEIYNFQELQSTLQQKGHRFRSRCDTEVVVHAYEEFGDSFVERLDGMFAIAIWDSLRNRLLLARDRAGKKPLYYSWNQGSFVFASETKALRGFPSVNVSVNWEMVPDYLACGYISAPYTMQLGIQQVPPATTMVLEQGGLSDPQPFWGLSFPQNSQPISWSEAIAIFKELFDRAVAKRMIADVPLGALLSGGLDSSAVVASMVNHSSQVKTFCLGFDNAPSFDERSHARRVASLFSTDHTEEVVRVDPADLLDDVAWHLDQPMADSSAVPTYVISREARRHVTVVLNGDGGDEALAGYERFSAALAADRLPSWAEAGLRKVARFLPESDEYHELQSRAERFLRQPERSAVDRYQDWLAIFDADLVRAVTGREARGNLVAFPRGPLLHQLLYLNFRTYLHDDLLVKSDRMSMAHSLEARSPFLDTELLRFVASLPAEMKATVFGRKRLLKRAMKGVLPRDLIYRRKHGFGAPVDSWFRSSLVAPFRDLVLSQGSRISEQLDMRVVNKLMFDHQTGAASNGPRLWALLVLESWLRSLEQTRSHHDTDARSSMRS